MNCTAPAPAIGRLTATAISSASVPLAALLVSASELTSLFVPPELQPLWMRPARVVSRTIEILPFAVAAAVEDIALGACQWTAHPPQREDLGARLRREMEEV